MKKRPGTGRTALHSSMIEKIKVHVKKEYYLKMLSDR